MDFSDLSKANLGSLQAESAAKKYEKQDAVKEVLKKKRQLKEVQHAPPPEPGQQKRPKQYTPSQAAFVTDTLANKGQKDQKQQEAERLAMIRKYELYFKYLPAESLPPKVKGSANWTWREASTHYNGLRSHLDGAFSADVPKKLFFQLVNGAEKLMMLRGNPLDLEPGFGRALEQNPDAVETELSEMSIELQSLVPSSPWYVRLGVKTAQFAWIYTAEMRKMKARAELEKPVVELAD